MPIVIVCFILSFPCQQEELAEALTEVLSSIKLQDRGVFVQASTLGSLEALLAFLKDSSIPVSGLTYPSLWFNGYRSSSNARSDINNINTKEEEMS